MNKFRLAALLMIFAVVVSSCQKELEFENIDSVGTLKSDSAQNCLPSSVFGTYLTDTLLGADNYIEIQVNVSAIGLYNISSDSINGYSFIGVGNFPNAGLNTVKLYATGQPVLAGVNTFTIRYNGSSCSIDVNVEVPGGDAGYTLAGAGGTCTGAVLGGSYLEAFPTGPSNTATLSVDVATIGNYTISTTTVNGVEFSATGAFTTTGAQTVVLTATGTPIAAGVVNYPVSGNGSNCAFSVTYDPPAPAGVFTLGGVGGTCTGATLNGIFEAGETLTSATVTLNVTVTTPGTFTIISSSQNGVVFSASGLFAAGTTQVVLNAIGTPIAAGPFSFDVTDGTGTCSFTVTFTSPIGDFITCEIDGSFTTFNNNPVASYDLSSTPSGIAITGNGIGQDDLFLQVLQIAGGAITPGTYNVNQLPDYYAEGTYTDNSLAVWTLFSDAMPQTPGFSIEITNLTGTRVTGTFAGRIKENDGAGPGFKEITNGVFDVPLQ